MVFKIKGFKTKNGKMDSETSKQMNELFDKETIIGKRIKCGNITTKEERAKMPKKEVKTEVKKEVKKKITKKKAKKSKKK